jgi:hypothetical protein
MEQTSVATHGETYTLCRICSQKPLNKQKMSPSKQARTTTSNKNKEAGKNLTSRIAMVQYLMCACVKSTGKFISSKNILLKQGRYYDTTDKTLYYVTKEI